MRALRHNHPVGQTDWVSTNRSSASWRKSKDTAPENLLRKALHAAGVRFHLHHRIAKGCTPDLLLPARRVAVFVEGDLWHRCPIHYGNRQPSGPNAALWQRKFEVNKARDARATATAEQCGCPVLRLWEGEAMDDPHAAAARVLTAAKREPRDASVAQSRSQSSAVNFQMRYEVSRP